MNESPDYHWRDQALCAEVDGELFYPEVDECPNEAKRVCALCPVRKECLTDALQRREPHGVWGGTTPNERKHLLREQTAGTGRIRRAA
jgi:WhiB family redox-sensing transcriptional regulator